MKAVTGEICRLMREDLKIFAYLDEDDAAALAPYLECRQAAAGEVLWREGDSCQFLAFIVAGRLDVTKETELAGKKVIVGVYGRGSVAGELCIMDGSPRAVTATALEETSLLLLSRAHLEELLKKDPPLGIKVLKGLLLAVTIRLKKSFDRLLALF